MSLTMWRFRRNKATNQQPERTTRFPLLHAVKAYMPTLRSSIHQVVVAKFSPSVDATSVKCSQVPLQPPSKHTGNECPTTPGTAKTDEADDVWATVDTNSPVFAQTPFFDESIPAIESDINELVGTKDIHFEMTSDGCGGAYFIRNGQKEVIGIFKPRDEEYMGPNNPRGYAVESAVVGVSDHPTNPGFRVGNGALRERAAFLLDELYGNFSAVPETTVMALSADGKEPKMGSVQRFVASQSSAEDMGTLKFAIPEVHKIGILDLRLFNTDRHAGNILLSDADGASKENQLLQMTPIDHGFCLPSYKNLDGATFDWLNWSQAQFPFTSEELDHISSLNPDRDGVVLRSLGIEEECVTTMRISTRFLQIGADKGFSLNEIAACVQREGDFSTPSMLEDLVAAAVSKVKADGLSEEDEAFHDTLVMEMEQASWTLFVGQPRKKFRSVSCFT